MEVAPVDGFAVARSLGVALGIGLLIGLERERRKGKGPHRQPAGIRTFALAALLGGLSLLLPHPAAFVIAGLFVATITVLGYVRTRDTDPGITSEIALVITFLLGALAVGRPILASGLAVTVAVLLYARDFLHRFVQKVLSEDELHDALVFAAAALVVLPMLPNRGVGPWNALNPYVLWRLVILVMAIGGLGYVAVRSLGVRGLAIAGFAGGFISSTATIGSMGAQSRRNRELCRAAVSGAILSTVATVIQMVIVLSATSFAVLQRMVVPLALAGLAAGAYGAVAAFRNAHARFRPDKVQGHAFDLRIALLYALTLGLILVITAGLNAWLGARGLLIASALAGFADAHAPAIAAASLVAAGKLAPADAVLPILVGFSTNSISKVIVASTTGSRSFALQTVPGLIVVALAAWAGYLIRR